MKFSEFKYERPDYSRIRIQFEDLVKAMENSKSYEELKKNIDEINKLRNHI